MRLNSLCLLPSSWHSSAGFPYFFAAIARSPLAFATRWIWAADVAESIETAAVRAPLCLRFPLLLGSVQAGVGLLSPPPTRRCGCCLFVAFLAMVGAVRGFPPLPPIPCRRLPFGILPFSCALGCPIGRGPQSHPVVASVRSGAGRSRILWSRVAMVGAVWEFPSLPAPAGDASPFPWLWCSFASHFVPSIRLPQRGVHSIMPGTFSPLMLCSFRLASRLVRLRGRLHLSRSVHLSFCA